MPLDSIWSITTYGGKVGTNTYGAETWSLTKQYMHKIKVTQRAMERCLLDISLVDRECNVEFQKVRLRGYPRGDGRNFWKDETMDQSSHRRISKRNE